LYENSSTENCKRFVHVTYSRNHMRREQIALRSRVLYCNNTRIYRCISKMLHMISQYF